MLELSSVFLALLTNRLPVVLGSVRVRSPRSTSKRLKGGTYVHKSIYYLQRPADPWTPLAPLSCHRAPHTRGPRSLCPSFPSSCPRGKSPRTHYQQWLCCDFSPPYSL